MSDDVFTTEVSKRHQEMIDDLESIDIDSLKAEGLRISLGGKTFTFKDVEIVADESTEDKIRAEYKDKLNQQQQRIREKINAKINQLLVMHQQKQRELDRKEEQMKRKYAETAMMPDVTQEHLCKGLSVVKGGSSNELLWVYRATYNPRFVIYYPNNSYSRDNKVKKPIPQRLANRMKQDMIILIKTKDNHVLSVVTRNVKGSGRSLGAFPHYHQQTSQDCWGSWRYDKEWKTPDDIIRIAKTAEAVLETINHGSLAEHNPTGLPRMETIIKSLKDVDSVDDKIISSTNNSEADEDIWNSI